VGPIEIKFYKHIRFGCLCILMAFIVQAVKAQAVIGPGGGEATGAGGTVSFSVGQVVYSFNQGIGGRENQGVQQPFEFVSLPVRLVYFDAKAENELVQVRWETASEENKDFFTVEKSQNGVDFQQATIVDAPGNSSANKTYNWTDLEPYKGISYYRLKQTDYDNSFSYSQMKAVRIKTLSGPAELYPNPVQEYLFLKEDKQGQSRSYKIFDVNGRVVENQKLAAGEKKIDMTHFTPNLYIIHYIKDNQVQKFKIIKH